MKPLSERQVLAIKAAYPKGTRLELVYTDDPYTKLKPGDQGTSDDVDDTGTIFVNWDSGSHLGLIPGHDSFRKPEKEATK